MALFWVLKRFRFSGHMIADFTAFSNNACHKRLLQEPLYLDPSLLVLHSVTVAYI